MRTTSPFHLIRVVGVGALVVGGLASSVYAQDLESSFMVHSRPQIIGGVFFGNHLGGTVELDGEWLAVGDRLDNYSGSAGVAVRLGSIHMYRREVTGWELKQYILPPVLPLPGEFTPPLGSFISIDGDRMALGGVTDRFNNHAGTVWIYAFNGDDWVVTDRIDPRNQTPGQYFGFGVQLDGELIVGAWQGANALGDRYRRQAYLFEFDGTSWNETRRFAGSQLENPNFTVGSSFGSDVAADGPYIAVGDSLGSTWHFQLWFRQPPTSNFSAALAITFD